MAFDNPDFVDVVVHSYRHRYGLTAGDPRYQHTEDRIAAQPRIDVPTIVLDGSQDTVNRPLAASSTGSTPLDSSIHRCRHYIPQERPTAFVEGGDGSIQPNTR